MGIEARMQPDAFNRLKSALENLSLDHQRLAEYVDEVSRNRDEEEIFRRLAFRRGGLPAETGGSAAAAISELYEGMGLEDKTKLRQWWHDKIRRQAYDHRDLQERLSWRYRV